MYALLYFPTGKYVYKHKRLERLKIILNRFCQAKDNDYSMWKGDNEITYPCYKYEFEIVEVPDV